MSTENEMREEYGNRATPSGTEGSAEQLNPEEYSGKAKLFAEVLNYENDLKRENADLRQRLQDAQKEILRLKEEVLLLAGLLADEDEAEGDTLPAKEKA